MNWQAQFSVKFSVWLLFGSVIFVYLRLRAPCSAGGQAIASRRLHYRRQRRQVQEILKIEENKKDEVYTQTL